MATHLDLSTQIAPANVSFSSDGTVISATYSVGGGPNTTVVDVGSATGTGFDDAFQFGLGLAMTFHLSSLDGGAGIDKLTVGGRGAVDLTGVVGIERFEFRNNGVVTFTDQNFLGVAGAALAIDLSNGTLVGGLGMDGSAVTAGHSLNVTAFLTSYIPITGGAGDDTFTGNFLDGGSEVLHGGAGHDTVLFTTASSFPAQTLAQIDGVEFFQLSSVGINSVVVRAANFVGVTGGTVGVGLGSRGGTIDGSTLDATQHLYLIGSAQDDTLKGGAADDVFQFYDDVQEDDVIVGGGGHDVLLFADDGSVDVVGASGIEFYWFAGSSNSLTIRETNFVGVTGPIGVSGGMGLSVDAQYLSAGFGLYLIGTPLADGFEAGAGDDVFQFTAATLNAYDIVRGGAGSDLLLIETAGVINVGGVERIEFYQLAGGGSNSLTLDNTNLAGLSSTFGVQAGDGGDTLDAGATSGVQVYLFGGAGDDTLIAGSGGAVLASGGGGDILTGGTGSDLFAFGSAEGSTVNDFLSGTDMLFFSDVAFDLGADDGLGGSVGFDRLDAGAFSSTSDGVFHTAAERFAFDAATGQLFYAQDGSLTAPGSVELVATLNGGAVLTANDLFFGA